MVVDYPPPGAMEWLMRKKLLSVASPSMRAELETNKPLLLAPEQAGADAVAPSCAAAPRLAAARTRQEARFSDIYRFPLARLARIAWNRDQTHTIRSTHAVAFWLRCQARDCPRKHLQ